MAKNTNQRAKCRDEKDGAMSGSYKSVATDRTAVKSTTVKGSMSKSDRLTLRASKLAYENRDKRLG